MGLGFRYMVRFHFCEPQDLVNSLGDRKFKVFINSQTAEQNTDVIVWIVQGKVPIFKDYVVLVSKEYITIHAKYYDVILNGIEVAPRRPSDSSNSASEKSKRSLLIAYVGCAAVLIAIISLLVCMVVRLIVSMPTNVYYTLPDSKYVPFVGQNYLFLVENDTVLEMAYRLNVGGKPISLKDDTGLFRLSSDDYFYMTKNNYVIVNTSMLINYTMIPRHTAPEMVYRTTQTMGPSLAYNEKRNLSWRLPMDWMFKVFINSQTAEQNTDVIVWTVQGKVPIFKDYVVLISKEYITIRAKYYDVILNGIEVAPRPPSDSSNPAGGKFKKKSFLIADVGCAAGLIAIISLLVCIAVWLQRKGTSLLCWWINRNEGKSTRTSLLPDELCCHFSLDEIKAATKNFHDDLVVGKGGFGKVYKGFMDEGEKIVAIKRLNPESNQGIC
ncbi:hypothetical protein Gotur_000388 [Gossypium turneri]